ncbi:MAG: hypothetical protein V1717_03780 [Candidatus Micrarchaeota archaeon]
MAESVSKAVREILASLAYLHFSFENHLANDSAVAKFIKTRVEEKTGKPVSLGAVTAAVRRFVLSFKTREKDENLIRFLKSFQIHLRSGLVEINLKRNNATSENLAKLAKKIAWEKGEKMYVLQRTDEITLVADAIHSKEILACASKGDLLSKHEGRAVITIIFDPMVEDKTFGGLHYLSGIFSSIGVTVHVVFSTYSANSFVIKEKDLPLVYKTLSDSLKEIHALYPEV